MRWILILILKESQTEALHDLQYKETNKLYGTSVCNEMCSKCNRFLFSIKVTKSITLQLQTLTIIFLMSSKIYTYLK
jgi:hypothetical protein